MPVPFLSRESPNLAIDDWCLIASQEVLNGDYVTEIMVDYLFKFRCLNSINTMCIPPEVGNDDWDLKLKLATNFSKIFLSWVQLHLLYFFCWPFPLVDSKEEWHKQQQFIDCSIDTSPRFEDI